MPDSGPPDSGLVPESLAPERAATPEMAYGRPAGPVGLVPVQEESGQAPVPPPQVTEYPVTFTGTAGEFFRVWIVNVALTFVTLGIYLPWARVRTRQYFYGHTWLDGHNFEYRANPLALLRGYLIVVVFFTAYSLPAQFNQDYIWISVVIALLFAALYPWLVRQSMRFQARNTLHRGLSFQFLGTVGESYVAYGAANIAASIGSIFVLPWAWFMQRRYQVSNLAYGAARGNFRGEVGPFYAAAFIALGLVIGATVVVGVPLFIAVFAALGDQIDKVDEKGVGFIVGLVAVYGLFILLYTVAWQYARSAVMAYVITNAELGGVVRARATFSPWKLLGISITNTLAQVFTLGLASPWAAIRRSKYILENIQVRAIASLDDFAGAALPQESALGEAATELLDIQVGF